MKINKHSGVYTLKAEQFLPISLNEAWDFFSSPKNLAKITPSHMGFNITSEIAEKMYAGQIITYKIGILPGIKNNWVTEITHVKDKEYFVDEQRFGPYSMWHHEHIFMERENGVKMLDKVSFKIPFGIFGSIAYALFIKKQLTKIFAHRFAVLEKMFLE